MKSISSADIEFYYSPAVMRLAYALSGKEGREFAMLTDKVRIKHLDKATRLIQMLVSDKTANKSMNDLTKRCMG